MNYERVTDSTGIVKYVDKGDDMTSEKEQYIERLRARIAELEAAADSRLVVNDEAFKELGMCILALDKMYPDDGTIPAELSGVVNDIITIYHLCIGSTYDESKFRGEGNKP